MPALGIKNTENLIAYIDECRSIRVTIINCLFRAVFCQMDYQLDFIERYKWNNFFHVSSQLFY